VLQRGAWAPGLLLTPTLRKETKVTDVTADCPQVSHGVIAATKSFSPVADGPKATFPSPGSVRP
jgi:hypothetical protein